MKGIQQSLIEQIPLWDDSALFPERLYVLFAEDGRQACYYIKEWDITGLAVFSDEAAAYRFGEWLELELGLQAICVTKSDAVKIAERSPGEISCLLLLDQLNHPAVMPL